MNRMVCKCCGATETRSVNCGFDALFVILWLAVAFIGWAGLIGIAEVLGVVALVYSVMSLFRWKLVCKACGSGEVIPANTPLGKKLLVETR